MKSFITTLIAIGTLGYLGTGFAVPNPCAYDDADSVLCAIFKVPSQEPPKGYYVKMAINGKDMPPDKGICMSDGSSVSMNNADVTGAVAAGILKLGSNTITLTQCSDSTCSKTGQTFNYTFTLTQSGSNYAADPSTSTDTLQDYGTVCTVGPAQLRTIAFPSN